MIALPIFLQMVLEYNAHAGRPVARAAVAEHVRGRRCSPGSGPGSGAPSSIIRAGFALLAVGLVVLIPIVPRARLRLVARRSRCVIAGLGLGPAGVPAQQLHAVARSRRSGSARRPASTRPPARSGCRSGWRSPAAIMLATLVARASPTWPSQHRAPAGRAAAGRDGARGRRRGDDATPQLEELLVGQPPDVQAEIIRINTEARTARAPGRAAGPAPRRPARPRRRPSA